MSFDSYDGGLPGLTDEDLWEMYQGQGTGSFSPIEFARAVEAATLARAIAAYVQDVGSGSEALADSEIVLNCNEPSTPVVLRGENSEAFTHPVIPVQVRATA